MFLEKEEIISSLRSKVFEKIEEIRHEISQSLFEKMENKELYFIFDKKEEEIIDGPFITKSEAEKCISKMKRKENLIVVTEKTLEKMGF